MEMGALYRRYTVYHHDVSCCRSWYSTQADDLSPIGVAIGLGVRESYNGNGAKANIVSGVLDAFSAGILLYTGLVELLGHEVLFNPRMMKASNAKLAYVFTCMLLGSGLMALLAKWA